MVDHIPLGGGGRGGKGEGGMTMGEKWLCEVRTIHYILVLPIGIFPGRDRGGWGGGGRGEPPL